MTLGEPLHGPAYLVHGREYAVWSSNNPPHLGGTCCGD